MNETYQLRLADNQSYPYKLIKSHRAKYIRIKVSAMGELSVVLPRGASEKHAHGFLQTKSQWVLKTIANTAIAKTNVFPESLDLKLLGECWSVDYIKSNESDGIQLKETSENSLEITGNIADWGDVKKVINRWQTCASLVLVCKH